MHFAKNLCQKCFDIDAPRCHFCKWNLTPIPILTDVLSLFKFHPCIYSKNGCKKEISADLDNLKAHDKSCIYRTVLCPVLICKEAILFKDVNDHLTQVHLKNKEITFVTENISTWKATKKSLINDKKQLTVYTVYGRQFFPQFYMRENGNHLYFRMIMLGDQIDVTPFKVSITFFFENKNEYYVEDCVYPINQNKSDGDQCTIIPMKKLMEYYDHNTSEYKQQPKIKFSLNIFSPKLDAIAKDKRERIESDMEDTDDEKEEPKQKRKH